MVGLLNKRDQAKVEPGGATFRKRLLRVTRRILVGALLALAGLVLLLTVVFLLAPTRGALLGWGVGIADDVLPGSLTVEMVKWPSLDHLVFRDLLWVTGSAWAPGDTLADVAYLDLQLDLGALRSKEGRVETILLDVRNLDIPAIVSTTAAMATEASLDSLAEDSAPDSLAEESAPADFPYLQPGSLPGIPSLSLGQLDLEIDRARLTPGMAIRDLVLAGRADARGGRPANAVVDHVEARFLAAVADSADTLIWELDLDHLGFGLNLEAEPGEAGGWVLAKAGLDSLNLEIAPVGGAGQGIIWQTTEPMALKAGAGVTREGEEYAGHLECDFVLPGSAHFHPWLPEDFPHDEFGSVEGQLTLEGKFADPQAWVSVRLDLGSNTWLENGLVAGSAEADVDSLRAQGVEFLTAQLDTFDIDLQGITAAGSGGWGPGDANLEVVLAVTDFRLPVLFAVAADPSLEELLEASDQVSLDAAAGISRAGDSYTGHFECDFELPGSANFESLLPEDFPHEEFDSLAGDLEVSGHYDGSLAGGRLRFDFGSNSWADEGLIAADAEADLEDLKERGLRALTAHLETLEIDVPGLWISARGGLEPEAVELDLEGELTDFELPRLFAGPELADTEIDLSIEAEVAGSLEDPEINADLGGSFRQGNLAVPTFAFTLEGDRHNVAALLRAGGGLELEGTVLDSVRAEVRGEVAGLDSLAANFGLAVWQQDNYVALGGSVRGDTVRVVHLDSLVSVLYGREMRTRAPATFTLGPGPEAFDLTELEISGEPGSILARGFWNEEGMDLAAKVDLFLREEVLQEIAPSSLWSLKGGADMKLDVSAELAGTDQDPLVAGRLKAYMLPHREEPPFGINLDFTSKGGQEAVLNADFVLSSADTALLEAQMVWPGQAGLEGGFWRPDPEKDLVLTVPPQKLDLERVNRRLPKELEVTGQFDVAAEVRVFPPGKGEELPDSLAVIPLRGSIDGSFGIPHLRIDLPNRSWIETTIGAKVSGPLADPRLEAKVEVTAGFIRIPEIPRNLHPVEGPSLLWALNDSLRAAMDTSAVDSLAMISRTVENDSLLVFRNPERLGPQLDDKGPALLPEMDLEVVFTNDLRVIGYGLDIKLNGGVKVARGYDKDNLPGPSVSGNVKVREGTLKVMNRVFDIERGNIKFAGDVPPNPHFDLMLESQVGTYLIRILVSGRAAAPVVELTSQPDLSEEDIMAVVLFGQPLGDLDNDQRGRMDEENDPSKELQRNMAGLAMAFGAKGLQDSMSDSFGVDMVQMGSDSEGGSTLMVGKFITPDIMLKYNQSLEKSGTYFMTLEYSLNRYFKLVSTYGQGEEASGAEVQWSKRY